MMDEVKIKKDLLMQLMKEMSDIDVARMNPVEVKEEMIEEAPEKNLHDDINNDKADLVKAMNEDEKPRKKGKSMGMQGKSLREQLQAFKK